MTYRVLVCADDYGKVRSRRRATTARPPRPRSTVTEAARTDDLSVQTFDETEQWPDNENSSLQFLKIFCNSTYPVKSYTLAGALTSVRAYLEANAPGGIADLKASGEADTPEAAQNTAAAALAAGSPGLALAALLEAHRLQPSRGTHLVNAAALATSVGLPNEAIAFLDAAIGREFLRAPLGIPHEATAAVIRGQALVMTGRSDAAQKLFASAKQLAPLLTEADAGLATVAACKGQDAVAKRYIARSRVRTDVPVPPTPPTEDPVQPEPDIDLTRGEAVPLRQLPIAETPVQAADMRPVYWGIANGFQAEIQANIDEANRLEQHLRDTDDARTRAEKDRRDSILVLLYRTHLDGDVENAQAALYRQIDKLTEIDEEFWGGGTGEVDYTYQTLAEDAWAACEGSDDPQLLRDRDQQDVPPGTELRAHRVADEDPRGAGSRQPVLRDLVEADDRVRREPDRRGGAPARAQPHRRSRAQRLRAAGPAGPVLVAQRQPLQGPLRRAAPGRGAQPAGQRRRAVTGGL